MANRIHLIITLLLAGALTANFLDDHERDIERAQIDSSQQELNRSLFNLNHSTDERIEELDDLIRERGEEDAVSTGRGVRRPAVCDCAHD